MAYYNTCIVLGAKRYEPAERLWHRIVFPAKRPSNREQVQFSFICCTCLLYEQGSSVFGGCHIFLRQKKRVGLVNTHVPGPIASYFGRGFLFYPFTNHAGKCD